MKASVIIPARYGSSRFEGKPLADINGKPMIQHVYERCLQAEGVGSVIVATDDDRIFEAVRRFDGEAVMTSPDHETGTDRLAEVARSLDSDLIVNVQGDEPLIDPAAIEAAIAPMRDDAAIVMGTLKSEIRSEDDLQNPDVVKVVTDCNDFALYFSRSAIPYVREAENGGQKYFRHIGLYVYNRHFLLAYAGMEPTPLERAEKLEQLRALENGYRIKVVTIDHDSIGVDRPGDLDRVRKIMKEMVEKQDGNS